MERTGVVGIVVSSTSAVEELQRVLTSHSPIIVGRMGVPNKETGENAIALIVRGSVEEISSLTGAIGRIDGINAKSVLAK